MKEIEKKQLYFGSLPDYITDAGLKHTKNDLEKVKDAEVSLIFEKAIRFGI